MMISICKNVPLGFVKLVLIWSLLFMISNCRHESSNGQDYTNNQDSDESKVESAVVVLVTKAQREDLRHEITVVGTIEAFEKTTVYSKVSGYLQWIRVDIGDRVQKGQTVARIEIPELFNEVEEASADLMGAKADYQKAEADLKRIQADFRLKEITYKRVNQVRQEDPNVMAQQKVDEAKAGFEVASAMVEVMEGTMQQIKSHIQVKEAKLRRLKTLTDFAEIKAPFNGVVTERFVDSGALIQAGTASKNVQPIFTVAQINRVRVSVDVPELKVPFVRKGTSAVVVVDALPGKNFQGKVARFATRLDPSTRTMKAEIDIPNSKRIIRPGMYGKVTLLLEESPGTLTVPAEALRVEGKRKFVYCVENSLVKEVDVEVSFDDGIKIGVTEGLNGEEDILLKSQSSIIQGTRVNAVRWKPEGE